VTEPKLTPTMRTALAAVEEHPGTDAAELPGGMRTTLALMRRQLVQWGAGTTVHPAVCPTYGEHRWRSSMHLDACHSYTNAYTCECGAWLGVKGERNREGLGYWYEPGTCSRCDELIGGARAHASHVELGRG
jgi:hypothetical protein